MPGVGIMEGGARPFWAELTGRRRPLTNAAVARALTRYPLMSQQVTGLIHWQAVKLAMKKVPFHHKPRFAPGPGILARSRKLISHGGIVERSRNRPPRRHGLASPPRAAPAAPRRALAAHPGGAPSGDVGPGPPCARTGVGDPARRQHPSRRRPLHGPRRERGCALTQPVAPAGHAGAPGAGRVVRGGRLARRRPGRAARDPRGHGRVGPHQPARAGLHPGPAAPSPPAGPVRPSRRQARHPVPLRPGHDFYRLVADPRGP